MKMEAVGASDWDDVGELLDAAFSPSTFESTLMAGLRHAGREVCEWVVRKDGRIIAHVAFTNAYRGTLPIGLHLAPVSVHPGCQRQGIGTFLLTQALAARGVAERAVFVLGDPRYYGRFGFQRIARPRCPFDRHNQHFQALRWTANDDFAVGYEPEFQRAGRG
jgi:putative acetyltransferase